MSAFALSAETPQGIPDNENCAGRDGGTKVAPPPLAHAVAKRKVTAPIAHRARDSTVSVGSCMSDVPASMNVEPKTAGNCSPKTRIRSRPSLKERSLRCKDVYEIRRPRARDHGISHIPNASLRLVSAQQCKPNFPISKSAERWAVSQVGRERATR